MLNCPTENLHFLNSQDTLLMDLDILQHSDAHFYLTGSRYFGNYHQSSDYDFFAQYDQAICEFLETHKYKALGCYQSGYLDSNTSVVYRKGKIDIQLVTNVNMKKWAQEQIKAHFFYRHMPKRGTHTFALWNMLFSIYPHLDHNKSKSPQKFCSYCDKWIKDVEASFNPQGDPVCPLCWSRLDK